MTRATFAALAVFALAACNQAAAPPTPEIAAERTAAVTAAVEAQRAAFAAAADPAQADRATAYQFAFDGLWTDRVPMTAFEGDVVLVVNTASRCGLAPQYEGLQAIYDEYQGRGFEVVGVPANNFLGQEPGSAEEIQEFCTLNYGVTFPMTAKTEVIGAERHAFYAWAETQLGESAVPQWNFHKLLIGRDGRLIAAFDSRTEPTAANVREAIEAALDAPTTATPTSLR
ncbi:MAG: glutathione peroxidase [Phycisphaerales bacterium]|nr:glutathione peroxidase [Hyphomonadaceae bacterium]